MTNQLTLQLILSVLLIVGYVLASAAKNHFVAQVMASRQFSESRAVTVKKALRLVIFICFLYLATLVWGVDLQLLYIFSASLFTLIGVAFFAVWSILSNVTAGIILFFRFPFRIGDCISFFDDRDYRATITDIRLFYILLQDQEGNLITVPNNIAIQKVIVINAPDVTEEKAVE